MKRPDFFKSYCKISKVWIFKDGGALEGLGGSSMSCCLRTMAPVTAMVAKVRSQGRREREGCQRENRHRLM